MEQELEKKSAGFYQRLYRDIIRGYTIFDFQKQKVYIKHLRNVDLGDIQEEDQRLFDKAKKEGLLTSKEKIELLIEQDIWSQKEEDRTQALESEISVLRDSLKKLIVQAQIRQYRKRIAEREEALNEIAAEREELIGFTCEKYVTKHITRQYLKYSLFSDSKLENYFLTDKIYDDISDDDLDSITLIYNLLMNESTSSNLQKIAAYPWFLNTFILCKNSPYDFFGKPVIELSNYQVELFTHASRYKSVLDSGKTPAESLYDQNIQLVVDWYEGMLDEKITAKGRDADGGTVFGASGKEMQNFADSSNDGREVVNLADEIGKTGKKHLGMRELLDIHGH